MSELRLTPADRLGFATKNIMLPEGSAAEDWRSLAADEIGILESRGNRSDDWTNLRVKEGFDPKQVSGCRFYGPVFIGSLSPALLEYHDLRLPVGLENCTIVSCIIGDDVSLHNVSYITRMVIEDRCLLFNINELITTDHAKFGNGVVMDDEDEAVRIWLEIANENGGRRVLPFDGMLPADAWIWSKYRADTKLMDRFMELTSRIHPSARGGYGRIGTGTVIKDCRILKDVTIGPSAYIKGCNKLKNLTINSDADRATQLGEGCELVNGIIGYGCRIFYGVKAVRFILNDHSSLKYGARLINSILGPNSTISCCEVLNSLIFGAHEQHHNSSFLCASTMMGQTNMASAATVGSNHNSRSADGEIVADRGFWPGLSVSLKHNSRFAAFTLIAKGAYPAELDVRLPFSLVSNDEASGELHLMPGYWFRYNMYALARNASKTAARDKRNTPRQELEYDWLAPDTVQQMLTGRRHLESWAKELSDGRSLGDYNDLEVLPAGEAFAVENSRRPVRILHAGRAWRDYGRMIRYWCVRELTPRGASSPGMAPSADRTSELEGSWVNIGGQLITAESLESLKDSIRSGEVRSWAEIHEAYREMGDRYEEDKAAWAAKVLPMVAEGRNEEELRNEARETALFILEGIRASRAKDYNNRFRNITFDGPDERDAVMGPLDENAFIMEAEAACNRVLKSL